MAASSHNARRQVRVPFQPENKPKPLVPIRCPFPDHDRSGAPLRFGLGQDKDAELRSKIIRDMKLGDINNVVEEASRVEAPTSARDKPSEVRRAKSHQAMGIAPCADESSTSLVTAMAGRLRHAEQSANALREEGKKKDATIQQLRVELSKVMRGVEEIPKGSDADIAILKDSNAKLREMLRRADAECKQALSENVSIKKFLKDYGMTWVGEEGAQSNRSSTQKERDPPRGIQYVGKAEGRCSPQKDKSTPSLHISDDSADEPATKPSGGKDFPMNAGNWQVPGEEKGVPDLNSQAGVEALGTAFDEARILSNVKKLNHVAGEGQKEIVSGADGIRRLREKCTVSYIFYKNGIYARGGPLRPFNVRESKVLVRDLMDGYFPWELKDEYPEGVPLRVEMRLDEMHGGEAGSKQNFRAFKGPGMALGKHSGEEGSTAAQGVSEAACTEVWAPSSGASMGNTLFRKLPERVIKNGSVVNVREDIRKMVSGSSQSDAGGVQVECVVEDVAMQEQDGDSDERKATLRVKMPSGDRVLELKLSYGSTILEMRMCIEKHLKTGIRYKVRSSFPAKEYTDDSATLEEAGLTPNALLFLTES